MGACPFVFLAIGIIGWKCRGKIRRWRGPRPETFRAPAVEPQEAANRAGPYELWLPRIELLGVVLITSALPGWHILPVFLDSKIAADPGLPGLSQETLPIATTAIFVGWMASSPFLDRALEIFDKKQLLVLHVIGLLLVNFALLTLPHLTAGNLVVFTTLRFVHGLLMSITALLILFLAEHGRGILIGSYIIYSLITILMSWSCGRVTLMMDWRLEAFLWCSVPMLIGLVVAFPNWWSVVQSCPDAFRKKLSSQEKSFTVAWGGNMAKTVTASDRRNILALAVGFFACHCGFYGLTYSAGQLSNDVYLSCMLFHLTDIFGYLLALSADKYGRNTVQTCAFLVAGVSLLYCSFGEPGSSLMLLAAVVGRLCLDVCFTTVYLALAEIFSGSKLALSVCETAGRLGPILAPFSETWPPSISCPMFATFCLAAAACTMTLPEMAPGKGELTKSTRSSRDEGSETCSTSPIDEDLMELVGI